MNNIDLTSAMRSKIDAIRSRGNRPRVYTCGSFDLINHDTIALFRAVKDLLPDCELMVGCYCDEDIVDKKGMTVLYEDERLKGLQFCKYVDLIYFPAPWIHELDFFEENEIDFVTGEINGWDLDLLRVGEDEFQDYIKYKNMFNRQTMINETPDEIVHRLEGDLGLRLYSNSKFNAMKNKIFSLPVEETDGIQSTPVFRPRSFSNMDEDEDLIESKAPLLNLVKSPSLKSRGSSTARPANVSLITKRSQTDKELSTGKDDAGRKKDAISLQYKESAQNLLAELTSHDMYLTKRVDDHKGASELIIRILRDRVPFYERSIRQGYSRKDLNLSVYDYYRIKAKLWFKSLCSKLS